MTLKLDLLKNLTTPTLIQNTTLNLTWDHDSGWDGESSYRVDNWVGPHNPRMRV